VKSTPTKPHRPAFSRFYELSTNIYQNALSAAKMSLDQCFWDGYWDIVNKPSPIEVQPIFLISQTLK
jgi:hypothetical protein